MKVNKSKLTCRKSVPDQLAAVGIDHKKLLVTYIQDIFEDIDIAEELESIASKWVSAVEEKTNSKGVSFSELLDTVNGAGYMEAIPEQLVSDLREVVGGTAFQGRAFKKALSKREGFSEDVWVSNSDVATTKKEEESPFD